MSTHQLSHVFINIYACASILLYNIYFIFVVCFYVWVVRKIYSFTRIYGMNNGYVLRTICIGCIVWIYFLKYLFLVNKLHSCYESGSSVYIILISARLWNYNRFLYEPQNVLLEIFICFSYRLALITTICISEDLCNLILWMLMVATLMSITVRSIVNALIVFRG